MRFIKKMGFIFLLASALFLGFVHSSWCSYTAPDAPNYSDYLDIKTYRLRLQWMVNESWVKEEQKGDCIVTQKFNAGLEASVSVKLLLYKVSQGSIFQWRMEKGKKPEGIILYNFAYYLQDQCASPIREYTLTVGGGGHLSINSRTGEYRLHGFVTAGETQITDSIQGKKTTDNGFTFGSISNGIPIDIKGTLTPRGGILRGVATDVPCPNIMLAYCVKPMTFIWSLEPWEKDKTPKVWVEAEGSYRRR